LTDPEKGKGKRSNSGRHHKDCPCFKCTGKKEVPKTAPDFSDLTGTAQTPGIATVDYKAMSEMLFDMSTGVAATSLGQEWLPKSVEERQMVCKPLAAYMKSKEMKDLPPGVVLSFVVLAYSMPRFAQPSTKEKLVRGWFWLKSKLQRKK
jgi:SAM-dependent MidA family methyltransferase